MSQPILEFSIQPRLYETDALGHINNVSISGWLELGRTTLLERMASDHPAASVDAWVVVSVLAEFAAETFYGEDVLLRITEVTYGTTSMTIGCELWQGGKLTVRGQSVLVHRDPATGAKRPIPEDLKP